jgi:hypothetical protein
VDHERDLTRNMGQGTRDKGRDLRKGKEQSRAEQRKQI